MLCEHLTPLEQAIQQAGIRETSRGQAWSDNCREWVYFDCFFDLEELRAKFSLPEFVIDHENVDPRSGTEEGFVCTECKDGIMGYHRKLNADKKAVTFF